MGIAKCLDACGTACLASQKVHLEDGREDPPFARTVSQGPDLLAALLDGTTSAKRVHSVGCAYVFNIAIFGDAMKH